VLFMWLLRMRSYRITRSFPSSAREDAPKRLRLRFISMVRYWNSRGQCAIDPMGEYSCHRANRKKTPIFHLRDHFAKLFPSKGNYFSRKSIAFRYFSLLANAFSSTTSNLDKSELCLKSASFTALAMGSSLIART